MIQKLCSLNERKDSRPVFKNEKEYEEYRLRYRNAVVPLIKKHEKAHKVTMDKVITKYKER